MTTLLHRCSPAHAIALAAALLATVGAMAQTDSLTMRHDSIAEVSVSGRRLRAHLDGSSIGTTLVDMRLLGSMPRILGNADPLRYAQSLPGVQTNSEYDAGLHMQGCDNQHNVVSIDGVPVYNPVHLLGFFSVFNATHFERMRLSPDGDGSNSIGGTMTMLTPDSLRPTAGNLAVGPMSSQGTLRLRPTSRSMLTLSARAAYLNLLYGQWLRFDEEQMRYGFNDFNLSWLWLPTARDAVRVEAYGGSDHVVYDDDNYAYQAHMRWHNAMGSASWTHHWPQAVMDHCLYVTHYANRFTLDEASLQARLPSSITDWAYRLRLSGSPGAVSLQLVHHDVRPQQPDINSFLGTVDSDPQPQSAWEATLRARAAWPLSGTVQLEAQAAATAYRADSATFTAFDPTLSLSWQTGPETRLRLLGGLKHQFLFRGGFSNIGLPTEFWFGSDTRHRPQWSAGASLTAETYLWRRAWRVEASVYFKRLFRLQEYSGNIYDLLYEHYNLDQMLMPGNGLNAGLNLMVEKRKGRLTGWVSYAVGRAMRRFPERLPGKWYPANHERIHELNAVATYELNDRWHFGASFVMASGTPYTAARQFYVIDSNVITEFSEHNAHRLRPYMRLDLSADYTIASKGTRRSGINFSLYNATMHRNDIFWRLKIYKDRFANRALHFLLPIMPSVNYFYEF